MARVQLVRRVRQVRWVQRASRKAAPAGPIASPAPIAPPHPLHLSHPSHPLHPLHPSHPRTTRRPVDPLDRVIDLGEPRDLEVEPPAFTTNEEPQSPPRPLNRPWSTQPSQELDAADAAEPETGRRKWPIAVAVLAVAIIAALSVGWLLRWRAAESVHGDDPGVDATIVDLPASAPARRYGGQAGGQAPHLLHPSHALPLQRRRVPRRARLGARRQAAC